MLTTTTTTLHSQPDGAVGGLCVGLAARVVRGRDGLLVPGPSAGRVCSRREQGGDSSRRAAARRAWGQTEVVRAFFDAPAKSRNGLPGRRPVVGNAISLRLDLPPAVIEEWFGK